MNGCGEGDRDGLTHGLAPSPSLKGMKRVTVSALDCFMTVKRSVARGLLRRGVATVCVNSEGKMTHIAITDSSLAMPIAKEYARTRQFNRDWERYCRYPGNSWSRS